MSLPRSRAAAAAGSRRRSAGSRGPRGTSFARTIACRSLFVAATTRTSTFCVLFEPTGRTSPSCRTRRSFDCIASGMSPISSRKHRPPVRRRRSAGAVRDRARERALRVAEELALEQVRRHGGAVLREERLRSSRGSPRAARARRAPCRCPSRPGSARDVARGDALDAVEDRAHRRALADHAEARRIGPSGGAVDGGGERAERVSSSAGSSDSIPSPARRRTISASRRASPSRSGTGRSFRSP
jgi:hypothetical protein